MNLRINLTVMLFSKFEKINWSLTKLYINVFTDNKLKTINKLIASCHHNVTSSLIALHALSGYNSVPMMFSIGKSKILKAVSKRPLRYVGDVDDNLEDLMWEGKQFLAKYYGQNQLSLSESRCTICKKKTIDHSVQKDWTPPPFYRQSLPYMVIPRFSLYSEPPAFGKTS